MTDDSAPQGWQKLITNSLLEEVQAMSSVELELQRDFTLDALEVEAKVSPMRQVHAAMLTLIENEMSKRGLLSIGVER